MLKLGRRHKNDYAQQLLRALRLYERGCALYYYRRYLQAKTDNEKAIADYCYIAATTEFHHAQLLGLGERIKVVKSNPDYGKVGGVPTDGISLRYAWARWFFKGKKASDWDWDSALAQAVCGEWIESMGYRLVGLWIKEARAIAHHIARDEAQHHNWCKSILENRLGKLKAWKLITYWKIRGAIASLIALGEIALFLIKNSAIQ